MLSLGACIGYRFELKTLAHGEATAAETAERLWEVMREGLIVPVDMDYRFPHTAADVDRVPVNYRFLHDCRQQAAYAPDSGRAPTRNSPAHRPPIASSCSAQIPEDDLQFEIVDHMNQGRR